MIGCGIYARKSTAQQTDAEDRSVSRQIANARAFAEAKGWTVLDQHVYQDDGVSGAAAPTKLRAKQRMLDVIRAGAPFQVLVMQSPDRLSRRDGDESFGELKEIARAGVQVHFYADGLRFEYGDFASNTLGFLRGEFAAEFRRAIAAKTRESHDRKVRLGHVVGGLLYGYRNVNVDSAGNECNKWERSHVIRVVDDAEKKVIQEIFQLIASGKGYTRVARYLNDRGVPPPHAEKKPASAGWAPGTVRSIVFRSDYRGLVTWGKSKKRDLSGQVHQVSIRDEKRWVTVPAERLRVVSDDLWNAAHERLDASRQNYLRTLDGRRLLSKPSGLQSDYLLVGLAVCATCGRGMHVRSRSHGKQRAFYYVCNRARVHLCANALDVPMALADGGAVTMMVEKVLSPKVIDSTIEKLLKRFTAPREAHLDARHAQIRKGLQAAERAIKNLNAAIVAGDGDVPATLVAELKARERAKHDLLAELTSLADEPTLTADEAMKVRAEAKQLLEQWRTLLAERQTPIARTLLRKLLGQNRFVFHPQQQGSEKWYELSCGPDLTKFLAAIPSLSKTMASPTGFEPVFWP